MAPKRPAPPPPVESSTETASGSDTDESSEDIGNSLPAAAPKQTAPPPQKVQQPEASEDESDDDDDEEEETDEEEDEGKTNHAAPSSAPRNPPQPPPMPESDESGDEEEEEETDDEPSKQEAVGNGGNHAAPPSSAPRNPLQPPPKPMESDESGDDEEEEEGTDDKAPKQEVKGNGVKKPRLPSSEGKKPTAPFQRAWSKEDEVRILKALAAHHQEHGTLPKAEDLEAALAGSLDNAGCSRQELANKLKSLKGMYTRNVKKFDLPSKGVDRQIFDLSKEVFGGGGADGRKRPASSTVRREFDEMCQMYPYLAEEMRAVKRTYPGLFKEEFAMISDDKARVLDQKIKKQRLSQMKVELRRADLTKEVTKTLQKLVE